MQRICRLICKICRICKQICKQICTKYDIKYAKNMQNMQKNMQNMLDHKTLQVCPKICKICNKYATYVSQNLICRICTPSPHFADVAQAQLCSFLVARAGLVKSVHLNRTVTASSWISPSPPGSGVPGRAGGCWQPVGYKPNGVINKLFASNVATMLLRPRWRRLAAAAPPEGTTMGMFIFKFSPGGPLAALLIIMMIRGRSLRRTLISRCPINST